jgi:hypothetical protein
MSTALPPQTPGKAADFEPFRKSFARFFFTEWRSRMLVRRAPISCRTVLPLRLRSMRAADTDRYRARLALTDDYHLYDRVARVSVSIGLCAL